jgi:hypothetical protein
MILATNAQGSVFSDVSAYMVLGSVPDTPTVAPVSDPTVTNT